MYHLNYFEFMVQQRVQILIKYVVCMGATTLLNNNMEALFTVLTSWGWGKGCFCGNSPWLFAVGLVLNVQFYHNQFFSREVIERRALQTFLTPYK